jgi:hypothetical protein
MPKKCRPCLKWRISKEKAKEWIFFRKKFLTRCLEQRKFVFLSREKTNLASQNIGKKKAPKETQRKNSLNVISCTEIWNFASWACDIPVFSQSKHPHRPSSRGTNSATAGGLWS